MLSSICCCLRPLMDSRSAMSWTFINMSWLKIIAPGDVFMVWLTVHLKAWTHIASALSIFCSASSGCIGGSSLTIFLSISATVLCMLLHTAFHCGFLIDVGLLLIPAWVNISWKFHPMNSPPLSWMHLRGRGYLDSQQFSNCSATCSLVLFLILMASTTLETGSMQVSARNFKLSEISHQEVTPKPSNCMILKINDSAHLVEDVSATN